MVMIAVMMVMSVWLRHVTAVLIKRPLNCTQTLQLPDPIISHGGLDQLNTIRGHRNTSKTGSASALNESDVFVPAKANEGVVWFMFQIEYFPCVCMWERWSSLIWMAHATYQSWSKAISRLSASCNFLLSITIGCHVKTNYRLFQNM